MRNMSFAKTIPQMEEEIKNITRRLGWWFLTERDLITTPYIVRAVQKGMGLKKDEKVVEIYPIQILSARPEPLCKLTDDLAYGYDEVIREGFPNMTPHEFVQFFCDFNKCLPSIEVNRIDFRRWRAE